MTSHTLWDDLWGSPEPEVPIKSSTFNSVKMAQYFQRCLFDAYWSTGFASVNLKALSGQFAQWKKNGATSDQVTAMIDLYMLEPTMRGKVPGWQDFLSRREQLASYLSNTGEKSQEKPLDNWDRREAEYDEDEALRKYLARRKNK